MPIMMMIMIIGGGDDGGIIVILPVPVVTMAPMSSAGGVSRVWVGAGHKAPAPVLVPPLSLARPVADGKIMVARLQFLNSDRYVRQT